MGTQKARQKDKNKAIEHYLNNVPGKNTANFTKPVGGWVPNRSNMCKGDCNNMFKICKRLSLIELSNLQDIIRVISLQIICICLLCPMV